MRSSPGFRRVHFGAVSSAASIVENVPSTSAQNLAMARNPWAEGGAPRFGALSPSNLLPLTSSSTAEAFSHHGLVVATDSSIPQIWMGGRSTPSGRYELPHRSAFPVLKQAHDAFLCAQTLSVVVSDYADDGLRALRASDAELKDAALGCEAADGLQMPREAELMLLVAEGNGNLQAASPLLDAIAAWAAMPLVSNAKRAGSSTGLTSPSAHQADDGSPLLAHKLRTTVLARKAALGVATKLQLDTSQNLVLLRRGYVDANEDAGVRTVLLRCNGPEELRESVRSSDLLAGSELPLHMLSARAPSPRNDAAFYRTRQSAAARFAAKVRGRALSLSRWKRTVPLSSLEVVQHIRVRIAPIADGVDLLSPKCFVGYLLCCKGQVAAAVEYVANPCCHQCLLSAPHYCSVNGYLPESAEASAISALSLHVAFSRVARTSLGVDASAYGLVGCPGKAITANRTALDRLESDVLPLDALRETHYVVAAEDACHAPTLDYFGLGTERAFEAALRACNAEQEVAEQSEGVSADTDASAAATACVAFAFPKGWDGDRMALGEAIHALQAQRVFPSLLALLVKCAETELLSSSLSAVMQTVKHKLQRATSERPLSKKRKCCSEPSKSGALSPPAQSAAQPFIVSSPFLSSRLSPMVRPSNGAHFWCFVKSLGAFDTRQTKCTYPVPAKKVRSLLSLFTSLLTTTMRLGPEDAASLEKQCAAAFDVEEAVLAVLECVSVAAEAPIVLCYFDSPKAKEGVLFRISSAGTASCGLGAFVDACQDGPLPLLVNAVRNVGATQPAPGPCIELCVMRVNPPPHAQR